MYVDESEMTSEPPSTTGESEMTSDYEGPVPDEMICGVVYTPDGVFAVFANEAEATKWAHLFQGAIPACYEGYMNALRLR